MVLSKCYSEFEKEVSYHNCSTGAQQLKSLITNEDIEILGRVESMAAYYESADVIIEPVFDGGGMKVKTIEALSSQGNSKYIRKLEWILGSRT